MVRIPNNFENEISGYLPSNSLTEFRYNSQ